MPKIRTVPIKSGRLEGTLLLLGIYMINHTTRTNALTSLSTYSETKGRHAKFNPQTSQRSNQLCHKTVQINFITQPTIKNNLIRGQFTRMQKMYENLEPDKRTKVVYRNSKLTVSQFEYAGSLVA